MPLPAYRTCAAEHGGPRGAGWHVHADQILPSCPAPRLEKTRQRGPVEEVESWQAGVRYPWGRRTSSAALMPVCPRNGTCWKARGTWKANVRCNPQPQVARCLPAADARRPASPWGRVAWDGSQGMLARTALLSPERLPWRLAVTSDIHMAAPVCRESRGSRADGGLMENFGGHPPALFWRFVHDQPPVFSAGRPVLKLAQDQLRHGAQGTGENPGGCGRVLDPSQHGCGRRWHERVTVCSWPRGPRAFTAPRKPCIQQCGKLERS